MPFKKTTNISTVQTTPEIKAKFQQVCKKLGFSSMAHFFTRSMETLLDQVDSGEKLTWPLRFETEKKEEQKVPPAKRKRL